MSLTPWGSIPHELNAIVSANAPTETVSSSIVVGS